MMESQDRIGQVGRKFPFLRSMDRRVNCVVKVQPFVCRGWFAKKGIVLEWLLGVGSEAV